VFTGPRYKEDGAGYVVAGQVELFVTSVQTEIERRIGRGALSVQGTPGWGPAGDRLVIAATGADDLWHDTPALYEVDLASGSSRRLTTGSDAYAEPRVSPDGRTIACLHYDPHRMIWQQNLALMERDGSHMRDVQRSLDRDVEFIRWTRGGNLLFSYADAGEYVIARAAGEDGRTEVVGHVASDAFSVADGGAIGFVAGSPERPDEAAMAGPGGTRVLTALNADLLRRRAIGEVRPLAVSSSFDRMPIPTWTILPPGYRPGHLYPTILFIHGGPWGSDGPEWQADLQLMAAAGYVVLYANPRGSTSYGWAHTIALPVDAPGHDYDDLMSAVDAASRAASPIRRGSTSQARPMAAS
jgi:acylaminoacyl-peptidase